MVLFALVFLSIVTNVLSFDVLIEQVFIAMLVDNFLYPLSAMRSHLSQSINWSGIRYHLKDGKICKVSLPKAPFCFQSCIIIFRIHLLVLGSGVLLSLRLITRKKS